MTKPPDISHREPDLMTTAEVAVYLRTPANTLHQWTYRGIGPQSMKVGRHRLYSRHDVDTWLKTRKTA